MKTELSPAAQNILKIFVEEAPKMQLGRAYNFVKDYQELRNRIEISEFIIMMLLEAMGFDNNATLRDKYIAEKLKNADDKIWIAISQAIHIHAGYVCSPFTPKDWTDKIINKFDFNTASVQSMKEIQLNIIKEE